MVRGFQINSYSVHYYGLGPLLFPLILTTPCKLKIITLILLIWKPRTWEFKCFSIFLLFVIGSQTLSATCYSLPLEVDVHWVGSLDAEMEFAYRVIIRDQPLRESGGRSRIGQQQKSNYNAGSTKHLPTQGGALKSIWTLRVSHVASAVGGSLFREIIHLPLKCFQDKKGR